MDARSAAAKTLVRVFEHGQSLAEALEPALAKVDSPKDRALAQALVYGVTRWYARLDAVAMQLMERPLRRKDMDVRMLLLTGLFEAWQLRTPDHAVVSATVEAGRGLRKSWAVGLLNALLRRFLREREALLERADAKPAARYAHPGWILRRLREDWPNHWESIVEANNQQPPMTLRVNRGKIERTDYLQLLQQAGIAADAHPLAADAIALASPTGVERLPGFEQGLVSVQDAAAQLAAELLEVPAGARVLDACAAPGGKACHLLERYPDIGELLAIDNDARRSQRIDENLKRLGLSATVTVADAADLASWWDGRPFDRILLDAPCSGSGVIRRHPDIKWLRRDSDIATLARTQQGLLDTLWSALAPGGKLLYVTCSVFGAENEQQVAAFKARRADCQVLPARNSPWGLALDCGLQLLPGLHDLDGFYYACLSKH